MITRKPFICGNWKMHLTIAESQALIQRLKASCDTEAVDVAVCPPFTALSAAASAARSSRIRVGAQNLFWEPQGAFTGEISAAMLKDAGCAIVLIGHSERRTVFGETDEMVNSKLGAALKHGLAPIVCIGETLAERDAGRTLDVLRRQLEAGFNGIAAAGWDRVTIAYEPVWAIGTGRNATPEQAQVAHAFVRQWIGQSVAPATAARVRIQYGGSVNASNALSVLQQPDVDGALVGGASLKDEAFSAIVKAAAEAKVVVK
ncbi:MAG: triose-phosphate isomerase [Candidatus Omnitrophica bacterium]|nr:triose-phosphate isomerase [Candidatus Omnitrophota bacterium]